MLVNAWDAVTARIVEQSGYPAVATTSAGIAASLGYPDGERVPFPEMIGAVERIARAVSVPVTADVESGYGVDPEELAGAVLRAGAVGLNLEDTAHTGPEELLDPNLQAGRIRRVKEAARREGVDLVLNARVDVFMRGAWRSPVDLEEAIRRAAIYRSSEADCIFFPGLADEATIEALVRSVDGPVNVLAGPGTPPISRLAEIGVARVSLGSGPARAALTTFWHLANQVKERGIYGMVSDPEVLTHAAINALVASVPDER